jgi:hypothetical protein
LSTNLFGPINMTGAIIPYFRRKKKGKLVFVGSVNGWSGTTASEAYSTSKFALEGSENSFGLTGSVLIQEQVMSTVSRKSCALRVLNRLFSSQVVSVPSYCRHRGCKAMPRPTMSTKSSLRWCKTPLSRGMESSLVTSRRLRRGW